MAGSTNATIELIGEENVQFLLVRKCPAQGMGNAQQRYTCTIFFSTAQSVLSRVLDYSLNGCSLLWGLGRKPQLDFPLNA